MRHRETFAVMPPDTADSSPPAPRIAVITAVAGCKDRLADPCVDPAGADFIAFVDARQDHVALWDQRPLPRWSGDPAFAARRDAKVPKLLPWVLAPGYDFYIWIDGNRALTMDPRAICSELFRDPQADLAIFPHPRRSCVYEEAAVVMRRGLDHRDLVEAQMRAYRQIGHPAQSGLFACGFFVIRNSTASVRMCLAWWDQVCRFSSRDQLSLPVAIKSTGCRHVAISGSSHLDNAYVTTISAHLIPSGVSINPPTSH